MSASIHDFVTYRAEKRGCAPYHGPATAHDLVAAEVQWSPGSVFLSMRAANDQGARVSMPPELAMRIGTQMVERARAAMGKVVR